MPTESPITTLELDPLTVDAATLDPQRAAATYREHGAILLKGVLRDHVAALKRDVDAKIEESIALLDQAQRGPLGWGTPNGALFLPAPEGFHREQQLMTLPLSYKNSAAFFLSALEPKLLDLAEAVLGPDVELFNEGQSLVKEPVGGHPKNLHQDAAYFEHRFEGPMGVLVYLVDTDERNGCLHVVPGSHNLGLLEHEDTFSHLGLNEEDWPWERSLPVKGQAGDAVIFHVNTIHGSKPNWSESPRPVVIHRYRRADDYVVVGAPTAADRAEAEKKREEARKENQLGFMVRGYRPHESVQQRNEASGA